MSAMETLETPIKAYFVNLDNIVPFFIKHKYYKEENQWFVFEKALWEKSTRGIQYPSRGSSTYFPVSPKDPCRPVVHHSVAYSVDEAIQILESKHLEQVRDYRKQAIRCIEAAERKETTNYRELVLGKGTPEGYVSPFTGKIE